MKPNIVFVLTDQWRAQSFGYAGDPKGGIPYTGEFRVQSPGPDKGAVCRFGRAAS